MNGEKEMKYAMSFLLGAVFGATAALLFAPSSGEELRANIKTQADTQYARLQDEYHKGLQEMHTRMDKLSSELQEMSDKAKESIKTS
jgi:gas vesicle protein